MSGVNNRPPSERYLPGSTKTAAASRTAQSHPVTQPLDDPKAPPGMITYIESMKKARPRDVAEIVLIGHGDQATPTMRA